MKHAYPILDPRGARSAPPGRCALGMMIKAPRLGASKTRLVPPLSSHEAVALSVCFLRDTASNIDGVASFGDSEGIAVYTPAGAETAFDGLLPERFKLLCQRGEDFGERLLHATEDLLATGYESVCLIDSDSPTMPSALLQAAVSSLARIGDRVVLGAADDGGYNLIGVKRPHASLFKDIPWSTSQVLSETLERARGIDLTVDLLPNWYDVDDAASLRRLCNELFTPNGGPGLHDGLARYPAPHTTKYLFNLLRGDRGKRLWPEKPASLQTATKHRDLNPGSVNAFDDR